VYIGDCTGGGEQDEDGGAGDGSGNHGALWESPGAPVAERWRRRVLLSAQRRAPRPTHLTLLLSRLACRGGRQPPAALGRTLHQARLVSALPASAGTGARTMRRRECAWTDHVIKHVCESAYGGKMVSYDRIAPRCTAIRGERRG